MIAFTVIGVISVSVSAALLALVPVTWARMALRRWLRSRQISQEAAVAAKSLTDEEVAAWLA
jgi:hypothetical protein